MKRGQVLGALAVALVLVGGGARFPGAADAATASIATRCIREGLARIPVTLRAGAEYQYKSGTPEYEVGWSGRPLPTGCEARRTVAAQVTVWFPHLRFAFWEEFTTPWKEFWDGREQVHAGREREASNASFGPLECPYKARARLRYEVVAPSGAVLGRRIEPVPVDLLPCPARIRSEEPPRNP